MRHDHLIDEIEGKAFDRRLMGRLLHYLAPYRWSIVLAVTVLLASSLLQLVGPYLVKTAIDDYIRPRNLAGLNRVAFLYLAVLLAAFLFRYLQVILTYWIGQRAMLDLRMEVFTHIEKQSLSFFDRNPVGRLMTRVGSDVEVLQEMLSIPEINLPDPEGGKYGLGVVDFSEILGANVIGHGGSSLGYSSAALYLPEQGIALAWSINTGESPNELANELMENTWASLSQVLFSYQEFSQ